MARTFELGRLWSAPHLLAKETWCSQWSARCELQHFSSCVGLSKLQVPAQQIRVDLDRIDGDGTGTASSSHAACATANGCHDGHGQTVRAGNPTERSTAGRDERNIDGTQYEGIEVGSGPVRVAGPKRSTRCNPSTDIGRHGKPSSSNGEPISSHRTGSIASFWRKSTIPPRMFATATWTSRTRN